MRGEEAAQPSLSRMNSMLRFRTFWRECRESLLWWAKEKECRDSVGKRARSSLKGRVGEEGPEWSVVSEGRREGPSTADKEGEPGWDG